MNMCVRVYKVHVCTYAWGGQKTTLNMFPPQMLPVFELGCLSRTLTMVVKLAGQHAPGSSTSCALRSQAQWVLGTGFRSLDCAASTLLRTTSRSLFSPSTTWDPRIVLRQSSLVLRDFTYWAISSAYSLFAHPMKFFRNYPTVEHLFPVLLPTEYWEWQAFLLDTKGLEFKWQGATDPRITFSYQNDGIFTALLTYYFTYLKCTAAQEPERWLRSLEHSKLWWA